MYRCLKKIGGVDHGEHIYFKKSKGLSDEKINSITASNYTITSELSYYGTKIIVKFNESYLKQKKFTYTHGKIVNIYIVCKVNKNYNICSYPTLENSLFGAVKFD